LIGALSLVIALLLWAVVYFGRDEYQAALREGAEHPPPPAAVSQAQGRTAVRVSAESQRASAMEVHKLQAGRSQPGVEVYGDIVDLKPLLDTRMRFLAAQAEARALRAAATSAATEHLRLKALYEDDRNVSERAVREADASARAHNERVTATLQTLAGIEATARTEWGGMLTEMALNPSAGGIAALLEGRELLVQVVVPQEHSEAVARGALQLGPAGQRGHRVAAHYVAPAPRASQSVPGATYFYRVSAGSLRVGMRVAGELRLPGAAVDGVIVPERAVVWHGGRAWCYVKDEEDTFLRTPVDTSRPVEGGWFNASGFEEGQEVVVTGAQLLLSEELKYQIRNENED
jgi:hypothetical protein